MRLSDISLEKKFERMVFLSFIVSLAIFASAFFASYIACGSFSRTITVTLCNPIYSSDTLSLIYSVARSMLPSALTIALVFLSAMTPLGFALSAVCLVWRGACLGCAVSLVASRALSSPSKWTVCAVILYFLSSVLIFILVSLACVYRKMISCAYASEDNLSVLETSTDLIKLFLVISGAIFTLSLVSIILLHTR